MLVLPPRSTLFPYTTLFRSLAGFAALREFGFSFDLQVFPAQLGQAAALAAEHGDIPIVLDHARSEEHTSELQSPYDLVCRLLLEKKNHPRSHHTRQLK